MTGVLNTREHVVIYFFWMVFAAMLLTAAYNMSEPEVSQKKSPTAKSTAPQLSPEEKIAEYQEHLAENPRSIQALIGLGDVYFDSGKPFEAINIFKKALEVSPGNTHALSDMGLLYADIGNLDEALTYFQEALKFDPNHHHSLYYTGLIYRRNGEKSMALEAFEKLLSLNPAPDLVKKANQEIAALRSEHGSPE
jgi:cytochrome c-type biogenesis protein CcmH/NrfG